MLNPLGLSGEPKYFPKGESRQKNHIKGLEFTLFFNQENFKIVLISKEPILIDKDPFLSLKSKFL